MAAAEQTQSYSFDGCGELDWASLYSADVKTTKSIVILDFFAWE
jgi:hypothetical protein